MAPHRDQYFAGPGYVKPSALEGTTRRINIARSFYSLFLTHDPVHNAFRLHLAAKQINAVDQFTPQTFNRQYMNHAKGLNEYEFNQPENRLFRAYGDHYIQKVEKSLYGQQLTNFESYKASIICSMG